MATGSEFCLQLRTARPQMFHQVGNRPHGRDPAAEAANRAIYGLAASPTAYCGLKFLYFLRLATFDFSILWLSRAVFLLICYASLWGCQKICLLCLHPRRNTHAIHATVLMFTSHLWAALL